MILPPHWSEPASAGTNSHRPAGRLKRSEIVMGLADGADDAVIVGSTPGAGRDLALDVVAEGMENAVSPAGPVNFGV